MLQDSAIYALYLIRGIGIEPLRDISDWTVIISKLSWYHHFEKKNPTSSKNISIEETIV